MEISEEDQQSMDLDWFCVDAAGEIGHFASAGFKLVPPSVVRSAEDRKRLLDYFLKAAPIVGPHEIDPQIPAEDRTERRLRDFVAMADRGLYSYDIESHLRPEIAYFRVALPSKPLHFDELPESIRAILERTTLRGWLLKNSQMIPYAETLSV